MVRPKITKVECKIKKRYDKTLNQDFISIWFSVKNDAGNEDNWNIRDMKPEEYETLKKAIKEFRDMKPEEYETLKKAIKEFEERQGDEEMARVMREIETDNEVERIANATDPNSQGS